MAIKRLKLNNSSPELFNFRNSFNCHWLELLRTASLPIHKIIINIIFQDGMNGIYLYFVNKHRFRWPLCNFRNSFNCHWLELLNTEPLPIHKVIINAIFQDGMIGIYLYFVNIVLDGCYWDFNRVGYTLMIISDRKLVSSSQSTIQSFYQMHC